MSQPLTVSQHGMFRWGRNDDEVLREVRFAPPLELAKTQSVGNFVSLVPILDCNDRAFLKYRLRADSRR